MDGGDNFSFLPTLLTLPFPPDPQNHVSQPKALVASEDNCVLIITSIRVNRWLEGGKGI
jgi:hypothetical protein